MSVVTCSRCGVPTAGECGPVLALRSHWESEHGGVPAPRIFDPNIAIPLRRGAIRLRRCMKAEVVR